MALEKIKPRVVDETQNYVFNNVTATGNLVTSNANLGNLAVANYVTGTLTTNAQPNITSLGTLGNLTVTGNISAGNIKTNNLLYANGSPWAIGSTTTVAGSNTQIQFNDGGSFAGSANLTFDKTSNTLSVTSIIANGSSLSSLTGANVSGQVANALIAGTVYTAAQPNITSLGTLTTLVVTGNITSGNANLGNIASANFFSGSGNLLSNIQGGNVIGQVGYAAIANSIAGANVTGAVTYAATANAVAGANVLGTVTSATTAVTANAVAGANVSGQVANALISGTVYTAAQPNITSVGTLTSLTVTGNITSGNANLGNLTTSNFFSGNGSQLSGLTFGNITAFTTAGITVDELYLQSATRLNVTASGTSGYVFDQYGATVNPAIYVTSGQTLAFRLDVTGHPFLIQTSAGANYNIGLEHADTTGTVSVTSAAQGKIAGTLYWKVPYGITGNYKYQCSIHGGMNGNIVVSDANIANISVGTVYTNAQPNITSVGTLTSLVVTGNITSGNANLGNNVTSNFFTGSGQYLTSVTAVTAGTVTTNAQPNITSVGTLTTLIVGNATANSTFGNGTITTNGNINFTGANVSLGEIGNIKITGGTLGYFITTDGGGNLSWGAASGGGGGVSATGSNTQIQFNDNGALGATANLTFNKVTNTLSTGRVVASAGANLGNNVSNVYIGGGGASQILATDGSGNLTWIAQPTATITVDNFTGDGTTTTFTLSTTPSNINQTIINYNGAFQLRNAYTLSGPAVTFSEAPANGSLIEVTTTMGTTSGAGAFVTRTYTGNGVQTNYTVTSGMTVSSVLVTENGLVQTPTIDYTIAGSTLTFDGAPTNGTVIQIRELAIAIATTVSPAYRAYTGNGVQNTFTVTTGLTANSLIIAENGILQRPTTDYTVSGSIVTFTSPPANGVDIQIRELSLNGGMSTGGISLPTQGGNSGKYLTTNGVSTSWANVSSGVTLGKTVALNMFLGI